MKKDKKNISKIPEQIIEMYEGTIENAEKILLAAEKIYKEKDLYYISFHLIILALEEIGKAELIILSYFTEARDEESPFRKRLDDHIHKLFLAMWGPTFGNEQITQNQVESHRDMARLLHEKRLESIYVDIQESSFSLPKDMVDKSYINTILELGKARLGMIKNKKFKEFNRTEKKLISWFFEITEDDQKRKFIMGQRSMKKLSELGNSKDWIKWLKEKFDQNERENLELTKRELTRQKPSGKEAELEKWKIKVRFISDSHSLRNKPFNWFNQNSKWFKLFLIDKKKRSFDLEYTLPKAANTGQLWGLGWTVAKKFIVALNIGSMGYMWWNIPEHTSKYYENIVDLENETKVLVQRSPVLKINWGKQVLDENCIQNMLLLYNNILELKDESRHDIFNHYLTGLAFISKSDIHLTFFQNAFEEFYHSFKKGIILYENFEKNMDFKSIFKPKILEIIPSFNESDKFLHYAECIEKKSVSNEKIEMDDAFKMKIICDGYFLTYFRNLQQDKGDSIS